VRGRGVYGAAVRYVRLLIQLFPEAVKIMPTLRHRASPPGDSVEGQILLTSKSALSITRVEIRFIGTLGCCLICALLDETIDLQRVFVTRVAIHSTKSTGSASGVDGP
jgi:hypothetical protein